MKKLYIRDNVEGVYSIEQHIELAEKEGCKSITLYEAKKIKDTDFFYCKKYDEVGTTDSCDTCSEYISKNNGKCKYHGYVYGKTDKKIIINIEHYK